MVEDTPIDRLKQATEQCLRADVFDNVDLETNQAIVRNDPVCFSTKGSL
jgi:hypothetical protein